MSSAAGVEKTFRIDDKINLHSVGPGFRSPVFVIFTSTNRTLKALEKASQLAKQLKGGIQVLALHTVPFTQPLDEPSIPFQFLVRRLEEMADQVPEETKISACACRDSLEALKGILDQNCPVVMGVRKRWWPTRDERLARKLRHAGYRVILAETE